MGIVVSVKMVADPGRDLKDAASKLESYLTRQNAKKTRAERRHVGDNSGTIAHRGAFGEKPARVN
jgi:hypothetical protein